MIRLIACVWVALALCGANAALAQSVPLDDGRTILLAQRTQAPQSRQFKTGQGCGSFGQFTCCIKNAKGEEICGCYCGKKLKGNKPQPHLPPQ